MEQIFGKIPSGGKKFMAKNLNKLLTEAKICGLDTMPFIYLFEKNSRYFNVVKNIFTLIEKGEIKGITSVITPIEILSTPALEKYPDKQKLYLSFFAKMKNLLVKDLSFSQVEIVSNLRRNYRLRTPDAIQLATTIDSKAKLFITNDEKYKKVEKIEVALLDEFV